MMVVMGVRALSNIASASDYTHVPPLRTPHSATHEN